MGHDGDDASIRRDGIAALRLTAPVGVTAVVNRHCRLIVHALSNWSHGRAVSGPKSPESFSRYRHLLREGEPTCGSQGWFSQARSRPSTTIATPALAKSADRQKADDKSTATTSVGCQAYQQAADGTWTQLALRRGRAQAAPPSNAARPRARTTTSTERSDAFGRRDDRAAGSERGSQLSDDRGQSRPPRLPHRKPKLNAHPVRVEPQSSLVQNGAHHMKIGTLLTAAIVSLSAVGGGLAAYVAGDQVPDRWTRSRLRRAGSISCAPSAISRAT